jgi:hypothetical protein
MAFLDKHTAVEVDRETGPHPLERAREKLLASIAEQIENLRASGTVTRRGKPVSPWWFRHEDGEIYTHIRFGMRPMVFPTGKAFKVGAEDGLIPFYEEVIGAIQAGELDEIIEASRKIGARRHHGSSRKRGRRHRRGADAA